MVTRIAWLYSMKKLTQAEIANRILPSMRRIQHFLEKAHGFERIRFAIKHPSVLGSIETRSKETLPLNNAVILQCLLTDRDQLQQAFVEAGDSTVEEMHP